MTSGLNLDIDDDKIEGQLAEGVVPFWSVTSEFFSL